MLSIETTAVGYRHGGPRISHHFDGTLLCCSSDQQSVIIIVVGLTRLHLHHLMDYSQPIYVHCIITIFDCYGIAIITADQYLYDSCLGTLHCPWPSQHPAQASWHIMICIKDSRSLFSHPHEHILHNTPTNRPPMIRHIICVKYLRGLGCRANGTIRNNEMKMGRYNWFGIHIT